MHIFGKIFNKRNPELLTTTDLQEALNICDSSKSIIGWRIEFKGTRSHGYIGFVRASNNLSAQLATYVSKNPDIYEVTLTPQFEQYL